MLFQLQSLADKVPGSVLGRGAGGEADKIVLSIGQHYTSLQLLLHLLPRSAGIPISYSVATLYNLVTC